MEGSAQVDNYLFWIIVIEQPMPETNSSQKKSRLAPDGERLIPKLMQPEVEIEHWHRYLLATHFVQGKKVLDIASGEGYGSALLAHYGSSVVGVDICAEVIASAELNYHRSNLTFLVGSCDDIPVASGSIDVVVSFETLEHHDRHEEMFSEIKRVLTPGGLCIISTPDRIVYSEATGYKNPFHIKELSSDEFRKLVSKYFSHCTFLGQIYAVGSLIVGQENFAKQWFTYFRQSEIGEIPTRSEIDSKYLIAIASDSEVESIGLSFLENTYYFDEQVTEIERVNGLLRKLQVSMLSAREERDACKSALQDMIVASGSLRERVNLLVAERDASKRPQAAKLPTNVLAVQVTKDLEDIGPLLSQCLTNRDRTIEQQHKQLQQLENQQRQLREELVRAEAQLDLLKDVLLSNLEVPKL